MKLYEDGWVQMDHYEASTIDRYWRDGFPVAVTPDDVRRGHGPEKRISPILDYDDRGIGKVQWLNVTHDRAAILASDGGWASGGTFHLWISTGAGTLPYELPLGDPVRVEEGEPSGWRDRKADAIAVAERVLGLRPISE